jgi:hypothetical protein
MVVALLKDIASIVQAQRCHLAICKKIGNGNAAGISLAINQCSFTLCKLGSPHNQSFYTGRLKGSFSCMRQAAELCWGHNYQKEWTPFGMMSRCQADATFSNPAKPSASI